LIYEIAHIIVTPGKQADFERGAAEAAPLFKKSRGCLSFELQAGVEEPTHYRLVVGWATVEDHTVHFRSSLEFQTWRQLVGGCFASPPQVVHVRSVLKPF
jgi:heme-degrading monooxygenase HmoA